jgi:hypothetical protein
MRIPRVWIIATAATCTLVISLAAWAQTSKAGLWEITTDMTMVQSPFPTGSPMAAMFADAPHTMQMCVTQEQIDKFGGPAPRAGRNCQLSNVQKTDHSMSADMVCTGSLAGKGSFESSWTDPNHARGTAHFVGTMAMGKTTGPFEWTAKSESTFKSSDCGDVKPLGQHAH